MSRIETVAQRVRADGGKLLVPYLVAGDPDAPTTLALMHALVAAGADIIELGIPFSDPSSDGPVIQRGVERALAGGMSLARVLELVTEFRREDTATPVVLMGYMNPIEAMGHARFSERARQAGVDGVLVVDMPPSESAELRSALLSAGLDTIFLVAPTTGAQRAQDIIRHCSGYLYLVSLKGVTGAALTQPDAVQEHIAALRDLTGLPIIIGFGIRDAAGARAMSGAADGVVIGSALVGSIGELSPGADRDRISRAVALIAEARRAMDGVGESA